MRQPGRPIPPLFPSPARPRLPFHPVRGPSPHSPRAQAQLSPRLPPTDQPGPQASRSSRKRVARAPTDRADPPVIALLPLSFSSAPTEPVSPAGDLARVPHGTPPQDPRRPLNWLPTTPPAPYPPSRRPSNPSRRLHSLRGSRAPCPAAPALLRQTAVGPGPRSGSVPTPGTFPKSHPATPTRAAAGFHPRPLRR